MASSWRPTGFCAFKVAPPKREKVKAFLMPYYQGTVLPWAVSIHEALKFTSIIIL